MLSSFLFCQTNYECVPAFSVKIESEGQFCNLLFKRILKLFSGYNFHQHLTVQCYVMFLIPYWQTNGHCWLECCFCKWQHLLVKSYFFWFTNCPIHIRRCSVQFIWGFCLWNIAVLHANIQRMPGHDQLEQEMKI